MSSVSLLKNHLLYDTGALLYFIRNRNDFINLHKLAKPFKFDQAIRTISLMYQGTSRIKIDEDKLKLEKSLISTSSACNNISAVWLKKDHGLFASSANKP